MLLDQENVDQGDVRRQIADLARTLASQNADLALAERCLEHLSIILETLGERPAAMWARKELKKQRAIRHLERG